MKICFFFCFVVLIGHISWNSPHVYNQISPTEYFSINLDLTPSPWRWRCYVSL